MKIFVTGGYKEQQATARKAIRWAINKLIPDDGVKNDLIIELNITEDVSDDDFGDIIPAEFGPSPRIFELNVRKDIKTEMFLETIFHEMVHCKQFATNELTFRDNSHKFKGKVYDIDTPYYERPWEWEAIGREKGLLLEWLDNNPEEKQKRKKRTL